MMKTAKLLLHCPDKPGILAEVTDFITVNKGNIIYLDQYVDHVENIFFMRIEWELKNFLIPQEKIEDYLLRCTHRNMKCFSVSISRIRNHVWQYLCLRCHIACSIYWHAIRQESGMSRFLLL